MSIDLFPTLLDLCGLTAKTEKPAWDGISIAPALLEKGDVKREALYWHYPHYHPGSATPYGAVRAGDWRLVEFYEDGRLELYNCKDDIGETTDLAATQTKKRDELHTQLKKWRTEVGAQMPTSNPNHDPVRDLDQVQGKSKKAKAKT